MIVRLLEEEIASCTRCDLHKTRTRAVPGEGDPEAEMVFIGEAPGFFEDREGRPFVGQAGKFLDELLAKVGLSRSKVYILNILKCRPPQNRDPLPEEINACSPWLSLQLSLLHPRLIITLGRYSLNHFFPSESISKVHGKPRKRENVIYYPMYHPAAALHQARMRQIIEEDFKALPSVLKSGGKVVEKPDQPQQLSLF